MGLYMFLVGTEFKIDFAQRSFGLSRRYGGALYSGWLFGVLDQESSGAFFRKGD